MSTIFISYAREDTDAAKKLADECKMRGADPWWDRNLLSGERYIDAILQQVGQADHFVLLLSESSKASTWVAFEVGAARARETGLVQDFVKIARLDDCDVPGFIGERHTSLWNWQNNEGLHELIRSLELPVDIDEKRPAGIPDKSLLVFRAGGQWMELIASKRGLECILVNVDEKRARIQWRMRPDEVFNCIANNNIEVKSPVEGRGWAQFNIGKYRGWRWTPTLFARSGGDPPEGNFKKELEDILNSVR